MFLRDIGKNKWAAGSVVLIVVLVVMKMFAIMISDLMRSKGDEAHSYCKLDNECVVVRSDVCGCNAGGTNIAINKTFEAEWNSELLERQKTGRITCLAVISDDWTCTAKPKCVNKKCSLEQ